MVTPKSKPGANPHLDVSVPFNWVYNHHYMAWVTAPEEMAEMRTVTMARVDLAAAGVALDTHMAREVNATHVQMWVAVDKLNSGMAMKKKIQDESGSGSEMDLDEGKPQLNPDGVPT